MKYHFICQKKDEGAAGIGIKNQESNEYIYLLCIVQSRAVYSLFHPIAFSEFDCRESREESETN